MIHWDGQYQWIGDNRSTLGIVIGEIMMGGNPLEIQNKNIPSSIAKSELSLTPQHDWHPEYLRGSFLLGRFSLEHFLYRYLFLIQKT